MPENRLFFPKLALYFIKVSPAVRNVGGIDSKQIALKRFANAK